MSVVNNSSTLISNADATPRVPNSSYQENGSPRLSAAAVAVGSADSANSTYRAFRIPSGARISSLKKYNTALTSGVSYNVGVYDTAANGGAAVSASLFAAAIDLHTADTAGTQLMFSSISIANIGQRLWEMLGLSADPFKEYDIVITAVTPSSVAGTIAAEISYAV